MEAKRQEWNANQKILRANLENGVDFAEMQALLLTHHASVHSSRVGAGDVWSFADEIWQGFTDDAARTIPHNEDHSLIWIMWHITRIEDITMNMLIVNQPQVFADGWQARLNAPFIDTGNEITTAKMHALNESIDVAALKAYRDAVGQQTQIITQTLKADEMAQCVDPARIQVVRDSGTVVAAADGVIDYWSKRTIAGLLLMPATRHNFIHLNEATRIKQALHIT